MRPTPARESTTITTGDEEEDEKQFSHYEKYIPLTHHHHHLCRNCSRCRFWKGLFEDKQLLLPVLWSTKENHQNSLWDRTGVFHKKLFKPPITYIQKGHSDATTNKKNRGKIWGAPKKYFPKKASRKSMISSALPRVSSSVLWQIQWSLFAHC